MFSFSGGNFQTKNVRILIEIYKEDKEMFFSKCDMPTAIAVNT